MPHCRRRRFAGAAWARGLGAICVLLFAGDPAFAGQNSNIAINDNGTHIDRGVSYTNSIFLTASGTVGPYTFVIDPSTPLPTGITVNSDGTLSGVTCGANGSYRLTVTATDFN